MSKPTCTVLSDGLVINVILEMTTITFGCHLKVSAVFSYGLPSSIPLS